MQAGSSLVGGGCAGWQQSGGGGCAVLQCGVMQCGLGTGQVEASSGSRASVRGDQETKAAVISSPHHSQPNISVSL